MTHAKFSTDGTTWTTATFTTTVSGNFVNFENTYYHWGALTDTGQIWKNFQNTDNLGSFSISSSYPSNITQLSSFNNNFIAVFGSDYNESNDLENWSGTLFFTWTSVNSNFGNARVTSIAYGNGLWIAGGYSVFPTTGEMRTSTNGSTWTTVTSNFGSTIIRSVAYANNLWVAGGYTGQIRTSTNGSTWTTVTSNFGNTNIFSVAYGNGLWVAGGASGQMRTSTNGSTWTTVNSNFGNTIIRSVAYGNGLWISGGYAPQISISTSIGSPINLNKFIKSQDEQKAAFLNNSGILFNWNGIEFERISTGINDNFVNGAIRNNGGTYEYIIQGNNALYRSTNLTTWTTISKPPASDVNDIIAK
jgi:hypothetical protein